MQDTGRVSSLEDAGFQSFLGEATDYLASIDKAWMDVIEKDGQVVAASLNIVHGKTVYYYLGGFSSELSRFGPGNVLFARAMQRGIDRDYRVFDFLRGAEPYKYRWGATDVIDQRLVLYPPGLVRGTFARSLDVARAKLGRVRRRIR